MKNRTIIGIICIVLAAVITFGVSPFVNRMTEGKTEVVCFAGDIAKGAQITEDDIAVNKISKSGIPENSIANKDEVIGKYAKSDLYKDDIATPAKITDDALTSDNMLSSLSGDKVAMSITISSFANGLSGKLNNGDIVSIYVTDKDEKTTLPPSLKYVEVITTTTSGGVDENEVVPNDDGTYELPTTITVLVSVKQASELANYEKNSTMHVALVYRGDKAKADEFIAAQDKYLESGKEEETTNG